MSKTTTFFISALAMLVLAPAFLFGQTIPPSGIITNPLDTVPRQLTINQIEVEGNETRSSTMIIATSGLNQGEEITVPGDDIGSAIRRLHRTGLFSDVQIFETSRTRNSIDLLIRVREVPRLDRFEITGVRRSQRRDLRDKIPLVPGFAVTESGLAQSESVIKRYFRQNGYRGTVVNINTTSLDTLRNRISLEFDIDRGERVQIHEITFEGNESFSDRRLRRSLREIKRNTFWRMFTRQTYERSAFEEAKENLREFYRENGFRDIRIVDDSVYVFERRPGREAIGVFMKVEEGPQYHFRNIEFEGNTVFTDDMLRQTIGFEKGDVFNGKKFRENVFGPTRNNTDVMAMYHDIGYLFLRMEEDINIVPGDSLDVSISFIEDEKAQIREVDFVGNTKTHDHVVRRNLRNIPGRDYSRSAIQRSVRELAQLGYFVPENIIPDIDYDYEDKTVDVIYSLDESTGSDNFELSGGFGGRQFGVILSARVNFNNFSAQNLFNGNAWRPLPSGDGQRLSLGVQLTGRGYQSYNFGFQEPWLFGRPNSLSFNAYYSFIRFRSLGEDTEFRQFGSSVSYGRRLTWPDDFFTQVTALQFQVFESLFPRGLIDAGTAYILSLRLGLERNSLDNPISPNSGSRFSASVELAPPLPGFQQYHQTEVKLQNHIPIVGRLVGTTSVEYGYLGWFSDRDQSQYQRYYLGGTALQQQQTFYENNIDLRGFPGGRGGSITPFDGVQPIGGRLYSKYAAEVRVPAISSEQLQLIPYVFFEAGNSYRDFDDFDPFSVKRSVGFGGRIFLPILGLIDLSYGYRLDGIPGTRIQPRQWEFLFNIGSPF